VSAVSPAAPLDGLVRLTLAAGERRRDLVVPSGVAVAEMLPDLARSVGAIDPHTAHLGLHLIGPSGSPLSSSVGLAEQGIRDGMLLTVVSVQPVIPKVYDDVVEAMADVIEESTTPWRPASARRTALCAAAALLGIGTLAIALARVSVLAGVLAGTLAAVLLVAAVVLARVEDEHEVAVVLAWSAVVHGAVGAFTAIGDESALGLPAMAAGAAMACVGAVAMFGLRRRRASLLPAVLVGTVVAAASGVATVTGLGAAEVFLVAATLTVLAAGAQPMLSLAAAGGSAPQPEDPAAMPVDPQAIPLDAVQGGAVLGHGVLLAVTVSTGLLVAVTAPLAVTLGITGALAIVCASLVPVLRTRLFRSGAAVTAGLCSGAAGLVSVALSVIALQPTWRPGLILVLTVSAAAVLVASLAPGDRSLSGGRLVEIVEVAVLVAVIPLTVVAVGTLSAVTS
jgi:type VII secretion integral membrane protein EccD